MDARDILIKPLVTEKTTALMEERKYTFRVRSLLPRWRSARL